MFNSKLHFLNLFKQFVYLLFLISCSIYYLIYLNMYITLFYKNSIICNSDFLKHYLKQLLILQNY